MFTIIVCGALFFPGVFFSLRKLLTSTFNKWNEADATVVSERLVSSIHASLATTAGIIIVTSCKDVMTDRHWLANGFVLFGTPYMAYDIYAMYLGHYYTQRVKAHEANRAHSGHCLRTVREFLLKDWLLVLHHLALLLVFMPIALFFRRGLGDFFVGCLFLTELSTPFVSTGKILIQLGLQDSRLHRLNGLLVLVSFFACRLLLFLFMYWAYGQQCAVPLHRVPFLLPLHCNLGSLVLLSPQVYWFILLCRKARRLYRRQKGDAGKEGPKSE